MWICYAWLVWVCISVFFVNSVVRLSLVKKKNQDELLTEKIFHSFWLEWCHFTTLPFTTSLPHAKWLMYDEMRAYNHLSLSLSVLFCKTNFFFTSTWMADERKKKYNFFSAKAWLIPQIHHLEAFVHMCVLVYERVYHLCLALFVVNFLRVYTIYMYTSFFYTAHKLCVIFRCKKNGNYLTALAKGSEINLHTCTCGQTETSVAHIVRTRYQNDWINMTNDRDAESVDKNAKEK